MAKRVNSGMDGEGVSPLLGVFRTLDSLTQKDDHIENSSRKSSVEYQSLTNIGEVNSKKDRTEYLKSKAEADSKIIAA